MEGLFQTKVGVRGERKTVANMEEEVEVGQEVNAGAEAGDAGNPINTQILKATMMLQAKEKKSIKMTQINLPHPKPQTLTASQQLKKCKKVVSQSMECLVAR